jgi:glyoxylase-like metal-dependent hydrolase (beta-lactamase superfamily II)
MVHAPTDPLLRVTRLAGRSYRLELGGVNTGLYVCPGDRAVLIDTGLGEAAGRALLRFLHQVDLTLVAVINTHAHADNCGGNAYLQGHTPAEFFASAVDAAVIERPELAPYVTYAPSGGTAGRFLHAAPVAVDAFLEPGPCPLPAGPPLEILDLAGHTLGHIGVRTPDDVLFIGDALASREDLAVLPIPPLLHVEKARATLERLAATRAAAFVPTHGVPLARVEELVLRNARQYQRVEDAICSHLDWPRSRDELIALVLAAFGVEPTFAHLYLLSSAVAAFLAELRRAGRASLIFEAGVARWFAP